MTDRKTPIPTPRSQNSLPASLPNISQLTSHESMSGNPMKLNTSMLEKKEDCYLGEDTTDWKNLYLKSRRQSMKIRSQHQQERDRLIKEKLALRRGNRLLQSALTQSRCNASKVLAERNFHLQYKAEVCKGLSARTSAADKAKEQSDKFAKLARTQLKHSCEELSRKDHIITSLKKEREELRSTLQNRNNELMDLDHVLEVLQEKANGANHLIDATSKSLKRQQGCAWRNVSRRCLPDQVHLRHDLEWYKEYYGTTPDIVLQFESSTAFRRLINMRYEVYRYKYNIGILLMFLKRVFKSCWRRFWSRLGEPNQCKASLWEIRIRNPDAPISTSAFCGRTKYRKKYLYLNRNNWVIR
ncbi:uncharacterized protein EAF02_006716 [Botrytis sinoallii]|uniref:uncharacterized protein n=1 Tax=Botrytis sinoallii TaxID=1463999 RepID=UPI00190275AF|nr:uncharacterized protein EAF02_006716 [Botrytis sinoallii]KAF7880825.1 hypothetical protein EAF02_006716 [Botrytis sinoallii]